MSSYINLRARGNLKCNPKIYQEIRSAYEDAEVPDWVARVDVKARSGKSRPVEEHRDPLRTVQGDTYTAKPSTAIETVVQNNSATLNGSPMDATDLNVDAIGLNVPRSAGMEELDALTTEQLAERQLARMNAGSYMTVTTLEDGGGARSPVGT